MGPGEAQQTCCSLQGALGKSSTLYVTCQLGTISGRTGYSICRAGISRYYTRLSFRATVMSMFRTDPSSRPTSMST